MAEIKKYVDWDGLVYYDGKSKQYIDDKFDSCLKVGGSVAFSDLPSPSANNLNYIFKITDSFVSNEYFEKPGYKYNAGTVVQVTDLERIYLYTIFHDPDSTDPGHSEVDLSNYYNKNETEKLVNDAIGNIDIPDVSNKADKEHTHRLSDITDYQEPDLSDYAKKTDIPDVSSFITSIPDEYVTDTELEAKGYLTEHQDISGKADIDHTHSISDITDYTEPEIPTNVSAFTNDVGYLTEHQSLEDYAKKIDIPEVPTKVSELENDAGYVTNSELDSVAKVFTVTINTPLTYSATSVWEFEDYHNYTGDKLLLVKIYDTESVANVTKVNDEKYIIKFLNGNSISKFEFNYRDGLNDPGNAGWYSTPVDYYNNDLATEQFVKDSIDAIEIPETDLSNYYNKSETETLVNEAVNGIVIPDTSNFITMSDVESKGYLTEHQDLSDYAKKSEIPTDYLTASDIENKADRSDLNGFATEEWVQNQNYLTEHQDISNKADISELNALGDRVTNISNIVDGKADATHTHSLNEIVDYQAPDLSGYARKSEIPDVSEFIKDIPEEYVTDSELEAKGYLTTHQDLSEYAKRSELPTKTSELDNDSGFITSIPSEYITESELDSKGYLTEHQSLDGKADVNHTHSLSDIFDYQEPDLSNLVTTDQLTIALGSKANDILFTTEMIVGNAIGGFSTGDSVQGMTISELLVKLLGLSTHESSSVIDTIITNELPAYTGLSNGDTTATAYQTLDITATAFDSDGNSIVGFYTNEEKTAAGYQLELAEQDDGVSATVWIPADATVIAVYQWSTLGNTWSKSDLNNFKEDGTVTQTVNGKEVVYKKYVWDEDYYGGTIYSTSNWRFEIEV